MEQITITAKIQIVATETDKVLLDETMSVYRLSLIHIFKLSIQTSS